MESDRTEAEVLTECQAAMGADLGELYFLLRKEHVFLSIKWKEFKTLFASKTAIDVLNNVAPAFFWQDIGLFGRTSSFISVGLPIHQRHAVTRT